MLRNEFNIGVWKKCFKTAKEYAILKPQKSNWHDKVLSWRAFLHFHLELAWHRAYSSHCNYHIFKSHVRMGHQDNNSHIYHLHYMLWLIQYITQQITEMKRKEKKLQSSKPASGRQKDMIQPWFSIYLVLWQDSDVLYLFTADRNSHVSFKMHFIFLNQLY